MKKCRSISNSLRVRLIRKTYQPAFFHLGECAIYEPAIDQSDWPIQTVMVQGSSLMRALCPPPSPPPQIRPCQCMYTFNCVYNDAGCLSCYGACMCDLTQVLASFDLSLCVSLPAFNSTECLLIVNKEQKMYILHF